MNNTPQKSVKRIVSKGQYFRTLAGKTSLTLMAVVCCLVFIRISINMAHLIFTRPIGLPLSFTMSIVLLPLLVLTLGSYNVFRLIATARQLDTGVPLTRANTADLPAPDSLVRASEEPAQAQQAVLLRPTVEMQERREEQLLRASAGE